MKEKTWCAVRILDSGEEGRESTLSHRRYPKLEVTNNIDFSCQTQQRQSDTEVRRRNEGAVRLGGAREEVDSKGSLSSRCVWRPVCVVF